MDSDVIIGGVRYTDAQFWKLIHSRTYHTIVYRFGQLVEIRNCLPDEMNIISYWEGCHRNDNKIVEPKALLR